MSKLLVSLSLLLYSVAGFAQSADSSFFFMPGVVITPFSLGKGYSSSAYYSLQFGKHHFPIKGVVRFGLPRYNTDLISSQKAEYTIRGAYIQPGFVFHFGDISKRRNVFFMGALVYLGKYKHHIITEVTDANWGTSQPYNFETETKVWGFIFDMGGIFTLHKKLKATVSLNMGSLVFPENPVPQIPTLEEQPDFVPGAGYGSDVVVGFNMGLHYIID